MWKVSQSHFNDDEMIFILVDIEDEEHWTEVDKAEYQVLEDMGLIYKG